MITKGLAALGCVFVVILVLMVVSAVLRTFRKPVLASQPVSIGVSGSNGGSTRPATPQATTNISPANSKPLSTT